MARKWFAKLSAVILLSSCQSLSMGDLLFHVVEKGNAITDVTPGMIDHVAIVISKDRFEVNPESWTQLKGSNETQLQSRRKVMRNWICIPRRVCSFSLS